MRQFIAAFVNIIAAIIAVVTLALIQVEFQGNNIYDILHSPEFEKTDEFASLFNERFNEVFTLISLKNIFEVNEKIDYDTIVAESLDEVNGIKKWTLSECLDVAKAHGLMIDKDYNVIMESNKNTTPFQRNIIYNFMFKVYPSLSRVGAQNEEEFITEIMQNLANYYKAKDNLSEAKTNFHYVATFKDDLTGQTLNYNNTSLTTEDILDSNAFLYISSKENIITSNIDAAGTDTFRYAIKNNPHPDKDINLFCSIDTNYLAADNFKQNHDLYAYEKNRCCSLLTTTIISGIIFLISLFVFIIFILSTNKKIDESEKLFFHIPTEFYIILYIFVISLMLLFINRLASGYKIYGYDFSKSYTNFYILAIYITTILLATVLATKYANDSLTLTYLRSLNKDIDENIPNSNSYILFLGIFIPIILFILISVYLIYLFSTTNKVNYLVLGIFIFVSALGFLVYVLYIRNGFNKALDVQVKSNEMRSSLIANVSHDIKTPLTSILNYTQIISDEIKNPDKDSKKNLLHYSEIITNKSNRLNELINDLIFDSKVRSGNVELDMNVLDLNAFINQVLAEFDDKLKEKGLKVILDNNAKHMNILADSSQLYRVFQNLFSNIYKYALENSRVYVDIENIKSKTFITIKNIQKEKIEVNVDTLKDRFVRGDKSRNTEGFGLGLSIAESLVSSMGGKLDIESVKDEFLAKLSFMTYDE